MIVPVQVVDSGLLYNDMFWMLGISLLVLPLVFFPRGKARAL